MRKLVVVLAVAAVLLPAAALAGGWATVQLSSTPKGAQAGTPWVVNLTVLQHGVTPLAGVTPEVRIDQGTVRRVFTARPTGAHRRLSRPRRLPARRHLALDDLGRLQPRAHIRARADRAVCLSAVAAAWPPPSGSAARRRDPSWTYTASAWRRSPRTCSTFVAIEGISSISPRNARSVTTSSRTGEVAVTVAVRGTSETSAISPMKSPAPRSRDLLPALRDASPCR